MKRILLPVLLVGVATCAFAQGKRTVGDLVWETAGLDAALRRQVVLQQKEVVCRPDAVLETVSAYAKRCDVGFAAKVKDVKAEKLAHAFLTYIYVEGAGGVAFEDSVACDAERETLVASLQNKETACAAKPATQKTLERIKRYFEVKPEAFENIRNSQLGKRAGLATDSSARKPNLPR